MKMQKYRNNQHISKLDNDIVVSKMRRYCLISSCVRRMEYSVKKFLFKSCEIRKSKCVSML